MKAMSMWKQGLSSLMAALLVSTPWAAQAAPRKPAPEVVKRDTEAEIEQRRADSLAKARVYAKWAEQEAREKASTAKKDALRNRPVNRLKRQVSKGTSHAQLVLMDSKLGAAKPSRTLSRDEVDAVRGLKGLKRRDLEPLPPKMRPSRGALSLELEQLYAQVEGEAWVLGDDGSLLEPSQVVAASRKSSTGRGQLAGLLSDLGLPMLMEGALPAPVAEDTASTPEAELTPEIQALAASLGNKPVAIFNYVRNTIASQAYFGSKKGAAATLKEKAGNDFDTASLLIALLRASGFSCRYEYGTQRLTAEQAKWLTGAPDVARAAYVLSQSGMPVAPASGNTLLVERAWVRAYVPYTDYRGTGLGGDPVWVRLDPSLKPMDWQQGVNLRGLASFSRATYLGGLNTKSPQQVFEEALLAQAKAKNVCNTLEDALPKTHVLPMDFQLLPSEAPGKVEASLLVFARPPTTYRWQVELALDGQTEAFDLSALQGKAVTLAYPGATAADDTAISTAGGITEVVPYQVQVAGSLRINGVERRRFTGVNPGIRQTLAVRVVIPQSHTEVMTHTLRAGAPFALNIAAGYPGAEESAARMKAIASPSGPARDTEVATAVAALYAHRQTTSAKRLFALQGHAVIQDVMEVGAGRELIVTESQGIPVDLAWGNYFIDVRRDSLSPIPLDGDVALKPTLVKLAGTQGSFLEHQVWEEVFPRAGFSAVRILQAASSQAVPTYTLSTGNTANRANLTGYSAGTLADVDDGIASGMTVTLPRNPITWNGYSNLEGYIIESPLDGTGAYKVNLSFNGGGSEGGGAGPDNGGSPDCSCATQPTGSTTDLYSGEWKETFTDLTLPGVGLPTVLARTYSSKVRGTTEFGAGWTHSYGDSLRFEPNGDVTWLTSEWKTVRFTRVVNGGVTTYEPPTGWFETLTSVAANWELRSKEGITRTFNAGGRLTRLAEPSGNAQVIEYDGSGFIARVRDTNNAVALTFTVTAGKVTRVTDVAGRVVDFTYANDNLTSARDATLALESYAYDADHRMTARTDKRGKVWTSFYDAAGRWTGIRTPLGYESTVTYDVVDSKTLYVDKVGAATLTTFNAQGNPVRVEAADGTVTTAVWNGQLKQAQTDARGGTTSFGYDSKGNTTRVTEPDGRETVRTYSANFNRLLTEIAPGQPSINNTYDTAGRLTARTDGLGTTTFGYDARGQLLTTTQPGSATTTLTYGANGQVASVQPPVGAPTTFGHNAAGALTTITDPAGKVRRTEVDALGRVTASIDALLNRTEVTYDAAGNRLTSKDAANNVTTSTYDDQGRRITTTDAMGGISRTEYDAEGRVLVSTDASGSKWRSRYDKAGRLIESTGPDGKASTQIYCADVRSTPCASVDALGYLWTKEFDVNGQVVKEIDPLGRVTKNSIDPVSGRVTGMQSPGQAAKTMQYGSNGLLLIEATVGAESLSYQYDARGNRSQVTANGTSPVSGQNTTYTYDLANRLLTEINPLGRTTSFTYDAVGNRASKTDGMGRLTTYSYDDNRRLVKTTFHDGTAYDFAFDARGNRTLEKSPTHVRRMTHDALGRIGTVQDVTMNKTITYSYDAAGNRTRVAVTETGNSTPLIDQNFTYDASHRLMTAKMGTASVSFTYDALGRRSSAVRSNGVRTDWSYDAAGQVIAIVHKHVATNTMLESFVYGYDAIGNRTSKKFGDGTSELYGYDPAMRLTQATRRDNSVQTYALDAFGNRTSHFDSAKPAAEQTSAGTFNTFNQLIGQSQGAASYAYDNNGNLTSSSQPGATTTYSWNADNRLVGLTRPGFTFSASYDGNGLRTSKTEAGATTQFLLDGATILQDLSNSNAVHRSYLSNPQVIDEVLIFSDVSGSYFPLADALGSVQVLTDVYGVSVRRYSYDVFGNRSASGTGAEIQFAFGGREQDASGLIYSRDRYIDPSVGKWLQPDRRKMVDGPNQYQYAKSSPAQLVDPFGLWTGTSFAVFRMAAAVEGVALIGLGLEDFYRASQSTWDDDGWLYASYGLVLFGLGVTLLALSAVAKCPAEIIEQEGATTEFLVHGENGGIKVLADLSQEGRVLTLRQLHIQGAGKGSSSIRELREVIRAIGRSQGARKVIVEGAARTSGANPGHVPRVIEVIVDQVL